MLRHIEGLTNPEIAEVMEIGVEAVESLTARGKRALTAVLAGRKADLGYEDDDDAAIRIWTIFWPWRPRTALPRTRPCWTGFWPMRWRCSRNACPLPPPVRRRVGLLERLSLAFGGRCGSGWRDLDACLLGMVVGYLSPATLDYLTGGSAEAVELFPDTDFLTTEG